jgi:hypothetical protein
MTTELQLAFPSLPPGASGPRDALANAPPEPEALASEEQELIGQGTDDLAQGLTYSHEHVKRLGSPDWRGLPRSSTSSSSSCPATLRIEWTRSADMSHLGEASGERRIHDALEAFVSSGFGQVFALPAEAVYRLHASDFRITFRLLPRKLVVLSTCRCVRPSRSVPRRP